MTRDPRVEPKPGDVLRLRDGTVVTVESVRVYLWTKKWDDDFSMDDFRSACADAEIVTVAP